MRKLLKLTIMTIEEISFKNLIRDYKKITLWQYLKFKFNKFFEILESLM